MSLDDSPAETDPARVRLEYDVTIGGAVERKELPFVVGVLADLSGHPKSTPDRLKDRKFVEVDSDNLDYVLSKLGPRLAISVPDGSNPGGLPLDLELRFQALADFEPESVARQAPHLRALLGTREALFQLRAHLDASLEALLQEIAFERESLERLSVELESGEIPAAGLLENALLALAAGERVEWGGHPGKVWLGELVAEVRAGRIVPSRDAESMLSARIATIDLEVTRQLRSILHHPDFRRLEAAWRGLDLLVRRTASSSMLKIRVLNVTKMELFQDVTRAIEFDQSSIFKKVYNEEYEVFGGQPFAVLIGDYELGASAEDVVLLEGLAGVAAAACAPFVAGASPRMFGLKGVGFGEIEEIRDISKIFDRADRGPWRTFRDSEDSRFVALALPRVLLRPLYEGTHCEAAGVPFDEAEGAAGDESAYLWGNAAWVFAANLADAFHRYGWCAPIAGTIGGTVAGLPVRRIAGIDAFDGPSGPLDTPLTENRALELRSLGFLPLLSRKGTDSVSFLDATSCQRPRRYDTDEANLVARFSCRLDYTLALSRFTHYLKAIARDSIEPFQEALDLQGILDAWILRYVAPADAADAGDEESLARYPLAAARVELPTAPGWANRGRIVAYLHPRFHLPGLPVPLRLVTTLPRMTRVVFSNGSVSHRW